MTHAAHQNAERSDDRPSIVLPELLRRWCFVVAGGAIGLALGLAYALLAPKWYVGTISVVPSQLSQDLAAQALTSRLPAMLGDRFQTEVQRIEAVLVSTSVADAVIERFNLNSVYGTEFREDTRKELWKHCETNVARKSGVVTLTCEDTDPERAASLASYFGEVGNRVFGRISVSSAREERAFLEQQVEKARRDVDEASRKLRMFREQHKIVDLPEQSKAVITAMASIKGELLSKQLELSYLTKFSARTEASVVQTRQQIAILENKLQQLESTASAASSAGSVTPGSRVEKSANFFPGVMALPELRYELEQLTREQKVFETVFFLMTERFELAKIDEARDTSTFQILDTPTLPERHSRPSLKRSLPLGLAVGLALTSCLVLLPVWWRRRAPHVDSTRREP